MLKLLIILGCLCLESIFAGIVIDLPNCFALRDDTCPNSNITYWLYQYQQPNGFQVNENFRFWPGRKLHVLLHGYAGNRDSSPNRELRSELLRIVNSDVLAVDFGNLVVDPCYSEAVHNIRFVSRCLAQFLLRTGADCPNAHFIGFGLGAHLAGYTAKMLRTVNIPVNRISALDPAKPLFVTKNTEDRLDKSDARFVDVVHSDIMLLGLMLPIGHADFYLNAGGVQPGCGSVTELNTYECHHKRSAVYFAESISSPVGFVGFACKDIFDYVMNNCQPSENIELLGYYARPTARGSYFMGTNDAPPYARGINFSNLDRNITGKSFLGDVFTSTLYDMMKNKI